MSAVLKAKIPDARLLRDVYLGTRYTAPDALKLGLIDAIGQNADEVVKIAREMAIKIAPKAATGVRSLLYLCWFRSN